MSFEKTELTTTGGDMSMGDIVTDTIKYVPYQLCPKCNGQGQVSKPPWIAGDVYEWSNSSSIFPCDVCNGQKIIPMCQIQEPISCPHVFVPEKEEIKQQYSEWIILNTSASGVQVAVRYFRR